MGPDLAGLAFLGAIGPGGRCAPAPTRGGQRGPSGGFLQKSGAAERHFALCRRRRPRTFGRKGPFFRLERGFLGPFPFFFQGRLAFRIPGW